MNNASINAVRLRPHSDVVYTQLDDTQAVLLHIVTGCYFTLNETGALIWEVLQEHGDLARIVEALEQHYDVSHEEAMAQAKVFLETLLQEKLVVQEAQTDDLAG